MDIGKKLKAERIKREWTQEYVATQLNVSRSTISSWEIGRTYPDLDSLVLLSDLYEVSLDILLREDTVMTKTLSKDIRKGRRLKWLVIVVLFIFVPIGFFLGSKYKETLTTYIAPENMIAANLSQENLTAKTQIEVTFSVPVGIDYQGYTETVEGEVLYISLVGVHSNSKTESIETIVIDLDNLTTGEIDKLNQIKLIGYSFGSSTKAFSEYESEVIWTR